jgi:hypothetical protein
MTNEDAIKYFQEDIKHAESHLAWKDQDAEYYKEWQEVKDASELAIDAINHRVKTGYWINVPCERDLLYSTGIRYTCSVCGDYNCYGRPPFCMYCGAAMRGEK